MKVDATIWLLKLVVPLLLIVTGQFGARIVPATFKPLLLSIINVDVLVLQGM